MHGMLARIDESGFLSIIGGDDPGFAIVVAKKRGRQDSGQWQ